jgi:hypothetical protein
LMGFETTTVPLVTNIYQGGMEIYYSKNIW